MTWVRVPTVLGDFHIQSSGKAIVDVALPGSSRTPAAVGRAPRGDAVAREAAKQIQEYVKGRRQDLSFPVHMHGTPFQEAVWKALQAIPYGETRSYGDIAEAIGKPGAARAVGNANNRNHLPLVVPCHRVVQSGGALGGYDGGEALKLDLLRLEGAWPPRPQKLSRSQG